MTFSVIDKADLDGAGQGRRALFSQRDDRARRGEVVSRQARRSQACPRRHDPAVLARRQFEPGHDHGRDHSIARLATAVGIPDASGRVKPAYCASACVLVYAGGKTRFGVLGSALGVHRFVTTRPVDDPVAEAQRIAGAVLGYMTKMGVSSSIVEAMSETRDIRWLSPKQALAMNLVTDPLGKP